MKSMKPVFAVLISSVMLLAFSLKPAETYTVDTEASEVKWTGYHIAKSYEHWGTIKVKSGSITMEGDNITGGEFVMDMTSIANTDVEDQGKNKKLVDDLKSERFFHAKKFPEAKLVIKSTTKKGDTYNIKADITIRGITNEISFSAKKEMTKQQVTFTSEFNVDRTVHEVMYGWSLENVVISNEFKLEVKLVAKL